MNLETSSMDPEERIQEQVKNQKAIKKEQEESLNRFLKKSTGLIEPFNEGLTDSDKRLKEQVKTQEAIKKEQEESLNRFLEKSRKVEKTRKKTNEPSEDVGEKESWRPVMDLTKEDPGKMRQERKLESSTGFGPKEKKLGVGVNRETSSLQEYGADTIVYSDQRTRVEINIEKDEYFAKLLEKIKMEIDGLNIENPVTKASMAIKAAVRFTPNIDRSGVLHNNTQYMLGEALKDGVQCVDRALLMEATLRMMEITQDAKMFIGVDLKSNHTDVKFSIKGEEYVAITMGKRAGEVLKKEQYMTEYLDWRKKKGLGERKVRESWGRSYFEVIESDSN